MENMENKKMLDDSELEQVDGGGKLFDLFTAEFREFFNPDDPDAEELLKNKYGIRTLEMRVDPNKPRDPRDNKTVKL
ncbi:MAG: hypothetical protein J6V25_07680 [Oscillospiraceae bacterium]|nr:hypothetical protein [Oscillospiraceae bacterium]